MKRFQYICVAVASVFALSSQVMADECALVITCGSETPSAMLCKKMAEEWGQQNSCKVTAISTPAESDQTLALYKKKLAEKATDLDVFPVDVVWPGLLVGDLLDLKPYASQAQLDAHFKPILESNVVAGKILALPWFTDAGLLYYRKDLLDKYEASVPETWEQLEITAKKIMDAEREAGNKEIWGFSFQGRAYEGLSCNALEWVHSYGGGTVVDDLGLVTIDNKEATQGIDTLARFVGSIAPKDALKWAEEESRALFHQGNAVFHRNWPYTWAASNADGSPIKGKVGVTVLPKGGERGQHTGTLGGWSMAVSKHSKNPEKAASLALFMTAKEQQKRQAMEFSQNPTIAELYKDPEVLKANPFMGELASTFANAVARPSKITGEKYAKVSELFWSAVYKTLEKGGGAADNLAVLQKELDQLGEGGKW
jgi:trehalose/maltose transport system substrate-binding protein